MMTAFLLLGALAGVALSAVASGSETGIYCVNPVRLRVAGERGTAAARRLEALLHHLEEMVAALLLWTNVADYLVTVCVAALFLHVGSSSSAAQLYTTLLVTPLVFVFGGLLPKECFRRAGNPLLLRISGLLLILYRVAQATGLVWLLRMLAQMLVRRLDPQAHVGRGNLVPRAHALHLLREGAVRGRLTTMQRDLIERVLNLSEIRVGRVMIPRARIAAAPLDLPRDEFLRIARMAHFSRLPIYQHDPRHMVGIANVYDVLTDLQRRPIASHVRPPVSLMPSMSVAAALLKLQRSRQAMAIVQDSGGHCLGILTIKDLVEEIVGDLEVW